jgi:hypothetical protein
MHQSWTNAIEEFTAMTAAINAGALARAGLLTEAEQKTMSAFLAVAENVARTPDHKSLVFSLRRCLETA